MKKLDLKKWFENEVKNLENDCDFICEGYINEITDLICKKLYSKKWSQKKFANEMEVSEAYITKMLKGNNNFTLKTLAKISTVLDIKIKFDFMDKNIFANKNNFENQIPNLLNENDLKKIIDLNNLKKENAYFNTVDNNQKKNIEERDLEKFMG
ncbi:MAG: helix-turn-helix domain-containing protein [Candidatus Muirbacterium halophilum]|nr:helix-turn-helix domain-containing protein [Candidatus Muirbacterium halophilum]MCK9475228.1 helix-turn-helix domain-containing protein [Candidatus Muirbacterium halophilum]